MTSFTVEINDTAINIALERLVKRGDDLRPLFGEIGAELKRTTRLRFDDQKDPDGKTWDPLSEAYDVWKHRKPLPVDKILHLRLDLRDTITTEVSTDSLMIGSNVLYARAHQLGYPKRNLPARPFLGLSEDNKDFILEAGMDYLDAPPNP